MPDPDEMDAAFDGPDDEGETHALLGQNTEHVPGDYDFERDYVGDTPEQVTCHHAHAYVDTTTPFSTSLPAILIP